MSMVKENLVKDWYAAWNSHDIEKTLAFYTEDCLFESVAPGRFLHGKKELSDYLTILFKEFPDSKLDFTSTCHFENTVCGEFIMTGTQAYSSNPAIPMTGKSISVRGSYFSEWDNNKVKRHTVYEDYLTIMRQLGVMPSPPVKK
jgi:steroid delta-isomerase-like uncharacterized protein